MVYKITNKTTKRKFAVGSIADCELDTGVKHNTFVHVFSRKKADFYEDNFLKIEKTRRVEM